MKIRVTTKVELFEKRKQQYAEFGYRIEDERPVPVKGLCCFVAVKDHPTQDPLAELVGWALNRKRKVGG